MLAALSTGHDGAAAPCTPTGSRGARPAGGARCRGLDRAAVHSQAAAALAVDRAPAPHGRPGWSTSWGVVRRSGEFVSVESAGAPTVACPAGDRLRELLSSGDCARLP